MSREVSDEHRDLMRALKHPEYPLVNTDNRKSLILSALRAFINQRSGIEFGNYGDVKAFRAEQRGIQRDRREALELLRAVELSGGIDADALIKAARSAYGGRLRIVVEE